MAIELITPEFIGTTLPNLNVGRPPADIAGSLKELRKRPRNWARITTPSDKPVAPTVTSWNANLFNAAKSDPTILNFEFATRQVADPENPDEILGQSIYARYAPPVPVTKATAKAAKPAKVADAEAVADAS